MIKAGLAALALCGSCLLSAVAAAEQYAVPGLGALQLDLPTGWQVREQPGPISVYLQIRPASGEAFNLQLTAIWLQSAQLAELARTPLGKRVELMAKELLPQAVEKEATLVELKGAKLAGSYFSLTARAAPEGQFKHLTQGMLSGESGAMIFTLLHREADFPELKQALAMLAGAAQTRDAAAPLPLAQDSLRVVEQSNRYELWLPASRIYAILPRGRLVPLKNSLGGSASDSRYFYFVDRSFNVSGWFEPAERFAGVEKFWQSELQAWKQKGLSEPLDVAFKKLGGWEAVLYDLPQPSGTNSHLRAHWVQDGTWIDVHLSLTSSRSSAELREALEAYLKGVLVRER